MVKFTAQPGFTLLELMLSVSVVAILFSAGISAYTKGQRAEGIKSSAEAMLVELQSAQKKSLIGDKDCIGALTGYEVRYSASGNSFTTTPQCEGGVNGTAKSKSFNNIHFVSSGTIIFRPLGAGITLSGGDTQSLDFRYGGVSTTYRVTLTKTGSIAYEGATN